MRCCRRTGSITQPVEAAETLPRRVSFIGTLSAEEDFAERLEEIFDKIVHRADG